MSQEACGTLRAAVVQLTSGPNVEENLRKVRELVLDAAARGAKLVALPENFAWMGPEGDKADVAKAHGPHIETELATLAKARAIAIVGGGLPEVSMDPQRPFNACVAFGPEGALLARYRKMHLFDVSLPDGTSHAESRATSPGASAAAPFDVAGFRVGLTVCYDVRFPELFRAMSAQGTDLFVVPAAFAVATGKDHWHVLLRARAIENQAYVLAPAQWGVHPNGRLTYGKSLIANPWGDVVAQCGDGEGIALADLSRSELSRVRAQLPCLSHRRL